MINDHYRIVCINNDLGDINMVKDISMLSSGDIEVTINIDHNSNENTLSHYLRISPSDELGGFDMYKSPQLINSRPTFIIFIPNNKVDNIVLDSSVLTYCHIYNYHMV